MPSVHFADNPVTRVSRQLADSEERVIYFLEDHLLCCRACVASKELYCSNGSYLVRDVKQIIRRARDGDFYSTRWERNYPVRLEVAEAVKNMLCKVLARPQQWSVMRVIYRRVEQCREYSIIVIERIIYYREP